MTYAVIRSGAKQYQVKPGDTIEVELLNGEKSITFSDVLLYVDGDKVEVGTPILSGITVAGEVVTEAKKGEKIRVFKFKHKSRYRKLRGHRQVHTVVKITAVGSAKLAAPAKKEVQAEPKAEQKTAKKPAAKKATIKKPAAKKAPVKKTAAK